MVPSTVDFDIFLLCRAGKRSRNIVHAGSKFLVKHVHSVLVAFDGLYIEDHIPCRLFFLNLLVDEPYQAVD